VIGAAQPAALTIEDARAVLAAIDATRADLATKLLIRFQALTCVRPTEAREAVWSEIDGALWSIPAERMKGVRGHKVGHDVPLSWRARRSPMAAPTCSPPATGAVTSRSAPARRVN
jgi:integrase